MGTKREWANKIAAALDHLRSELECGKLTPAQHFSAERNLFSGMQKESGYADGAFAQVWQAACKQHDLHKFGWCGKSEF